MQISNTPSPPYFAVIFTNLLNEAHHGYDEMAKLMEQLVVNQNGYLGHESVRNGLGITVSYWESLAAIKTWKANSDHQIAQKLGRKDWYKQFKVRICKVEHDYDFFT
ncbi:antibiotic biosynthesis monooxygenase family protein [Belliella pelovolcani]|uniref:Heme-degrading monooxygenase HmoA n=1 Tax=Belliella pelovolcani TaxID=529505 RepID=A0A1N7LDN1_9BACT|nr:antibiotic biosynthesis monooxygenase [Belliella pelovolcani]SIS71883.1 Heme-degrading monooxygenase HmoA [Belliella pelovolcani]